MTRSAPATSDAGRGRPTVVTGIAGFLLMQGIGSMYGLSGLQAALPATTAIGPAAALLPFGATCVGLAVGSGLSGAANARFGPRCTGMVGVLVWAAAIFAAGAAIPAGRLGILLATFGIGGIGVGLTYLTIVATVGPAFPKQPLVGSAIGPLGFASGMAALMIVAANCFDTDSATSVGGALIWTGVVTAAITLTAGWGLPGRATETPPPAKSTARPARRALSLLLFSNAYPGMLLLDIVIPLLTETPQHPKAAISELIVAATTIALFLGGLLAPRLRAVLGAQRAFCVILLIRGAALLVVSFAPSTAALIVLVALILFGHGAGFGILPGLMRAQDHRARFAGNYAIVLISWGVAGVAGTLVAMVTWSITGGFSIALVTAGAVAVIGAVVLAVSGKVIPALVDADA